MNERRAFTRYAIQLPINVSTSVRRDRVGMIRDVSASGVRFQCFSRFAVGERVELMFRLLDTPDTAMGQVVRTDPVANVDTVYRFVTTVQFDAPLDVPLHEVAARVVD